MNNSNRFKAIRKLFAECRMVCGWAPLPVRDADPVAALWMQMLDRRGISEKLFPQLLQMAVEHRADDMKNGRQITPLTVELIMVMYDRYKDVMFKRRQDILADISLVRQAAWINKTGTAEYAWKILERFGFSTDSEETIDGATDRLLELLSQQLSELDET